MWSLAGGKGVGDVVVCRHCGSVVWGKRVQCWIGCPQALCYGQIRVGVRDGEMKGRAMVMVGTSGMWRRRLLGECGHAECGCGYGSGIKIGGVEACGEMRSKWGRKENSKIFGSHLGVSCKGIMGRYHR